MQHKLGQAEPSKFSDTISGGKIVPIVLPMVMVLFLLALLLYVSTFLHPAPSAGVECD